MSLGKTRKTCGAVVLTIGLLLGCLLPAVVIPVSAETVTVKADSINKERGIGQLIIYTSAFGATTGTNEWGYEVVVDENNKVTKVGGNNNPIPAKGFVLSGHDNDADSSKQMKTYLKNTVQVGEYVYYNKSTLEITVSDKPVTQNFFYSSEASISGVNIACDNNSLVVYNEGYSTQGKESDYEVVCEGGRITSLGGSYNRIPTDGGFVLSGKGTAADWLKANAKLGTTVTLDQSKKTVSFVFDKKAAASGLSLGIQSVQDKYDAALKLYTYVDYKAAQAKMEEVKSSIDKSVKALNNGGKTSDFETAYYQIQKDLDGLQALLTESRPVEYRGVWLRPTQKTKEDVDAYVQKLYDAGINLICIETLYDSTMIMPMPEDSLFEQNPEWKGFDMLQAYIDSCHARNMELYVWLPTFYVGNKNGKNSELSVGTKKPEWLSVSNSGSNYAPDDSQYFQMISPSNKEATDYLLDTYKYILQKYDIDGWQLDYIRYYENSKSYDFGYDETALNAFEAQYGVRPVYNTSASYWKDWVAFRAQYVTNMVASVRALINEVRPSVVLSADVGPNIEVAHDTLYQDYTTWIKKGYLDVLLPMAYGKGFDPQIAEQVKDCGDNTFVAVGLGTFMDELNASDMLTQATANNRLGADGSAFFEATSFFDKGTDTVLANSLYKTRAVTPTLNKKDALVTVLKYAAGRIDDVILPNGGMTQSEANTVKEAFQEIITSVSSNTAVEDRFASAETAVQSLENENAKKIILSDLAYARKIATVANYLPRSIMSDESSAASSDTAKSVTSAASHGWILPSVLVVAAMLIAVAGCMFIKTAKRNHKE